jgi:hypothetical protein
LEKNIKIKIKEIGFGGVEGIKMAQDIVQCRALSNRTMILRVTQKVMNLLSDCKIFRRILHDGVDTSHHKQKRGMKSDSRGYF